MKMEAVRGHSSPATVLIVTSQFLSAEWECVVLNDRLVTVPHTLAIDED